MGCEKRFITEEDLEKHMEATRCGGLKTYHCESCNQQFYSEYELMGHMKRNHQSFVMKREHNCDECGKRFQSYQDLMKHISWHKKYGKWECEICGVWGYFFRLQTYKKYKDHMMEHEKRKFACRICQKSFRR